LKRFVKQTFHASEEAFGLGEIAQTGTIRTPQVLQVEDHQITLEEIECEPDSRRFWTKFGESLARMHKQPQKEFGFAIDNHIGKTPQANPRSNKLWAEYFIDFRLKPMAQRVKAEIDYGPIYTKLAPVDEPPSLVHGDLWNGNFLCAVGGSRC
jgi:protein-ribulosamine 3-kinase